MINKNEITKLKGDGFLKQKQEDYFSVRILSIAGNMTSEQIIHISEIAKKFGRGYIGFTTRLCVEIPWIHYDDITEVKEQLKKYNLRIGGTGKKVRPLVACKGTVCTHGIIDTQGFCAKLHDKYFAKDLPSKFKIGIVGCPNNCAKASLNDLGFMGQAVPKFDSNKCVACGLCTSVCKTEALRKVDGKIIFNKDNCLNCGECVKQCKKSALTIEKQGVCIFIGGKFGRKYRLGSKLDGIYTLEEAEAIAEKIIDFYNKNGDTGERFSNMIDRLGFDNIKKQF